MNRKLNGGDCSYIHEGASISQDPTSGLKTVQSSKISCGLPFDPDE